MIPNISIHIEEGDEISILWGVNAFCVEIGSRAGIFAPSVAKVRELHEKIGEWLAAQEERDLAASEEVRIEETWVYPPPSSGVAA